jgi:hypothetical protein
MSELMGNPGDMDIEEQRFIEKEGIMTNLKQTLSIGLAASTMVVATFFATALLLLRPSFAPLVAQIGITPGTVPQWFGPVFGIGAILLAVTTFTVSWKQRSFTVAWLLAVSGIVYMIPGLLALDAVNFAVFLIPGPIVSVIVGLLIFGLGAAKGIRTAMTPVVTVTNYRGLE